MTKKNVLVFRALPEDQLARLQAAHHVIVADPRKAPEAFAAALATANGLIGSSYNVDAALLDAAPQLEVISSVSVGVDNYALAELHKRGIVLCHTPDVLTETVADTVFAILMATQRRVVELSNLVREGNWTRNIGEEFFGTDVHGKTLGILGFGRIGQAVARRAALGFGMPVLYHSRRAVDLAAQAPELQGRAMHTPLDDLLARADIVLAMLPLTDATRGILNKTTLGALKRGGYLIHIARGGHLVEEDLIPLIDSGHLAGATLDVFQQEPLPGEHAFWRHPKITVTPHGSARTLRRESIAQIAGKIRAMQRGEAVAGVVEPERGY